LINGGILAALGTRKKTVKDRVIPSPSPHPSPRGRGRTLGSSRRAECARTFDRAGVSRAASAPSFDAWDQSQHSSNVEEAFARSPSPRGRGRGEGEGFVRFSIASPILQVPLPIPPKMAKNRNLAHQSRLVGRNCCPELHPLRFGSITTKYVHLQLFSSFDTTTCEVAHSSRAVRFAKLRCTCRGQVSNAPPIQRPGSEWLASTDGRMDGGR